MLTCLGYRSILEPSTPTHLEARSMRATLKGKLIADSDDTVENGGYLYFPPSAVRLARIMHEA